MKNIEKVIRDRSHKIELNNLTIIDYKNDNEILCVCNKCKYDLLDKYRNLSYKNFKCKYCELLSISDLLKNNEVKIIKICYVSQGF